MNVLHMQGACMAAQLVAACFACSLVHPQRAVDFATYTPLELWEGAHLFHDPYKYARACLAPVHLCKTLCQHRNTLQSILSSTMFIPLRTL